MPADQVVNAVPPSRRQRTRRPRTTKPVGPPRIVETLRKAIEWRRQLDSGEVPNQAAIACSEGITRARVTQVLGLLRLAPDVQERVLSLPDMVVRRAITERALRPITQLESAVEQKAGFQRLIRQVVYPGRVGSVGVACGGSECVSHGMRGSGHEVAVG